MKNTTQLVTAIVVGLFMLNVTAASAAESFSYEEDFDGDSGTLPTDWFFTEDSQFSTPIVEQDGNSNLRMARTFSNSSGISRRSTFAGSADGIDSSSWTDYTIDAMMSNDNAGNQPGLLGRWQGEDNVNQGYVAFVSGDTLSIGRDFDGANMDDTQLDSTTMSRSIDADENLRMTFDLSGDTLEAEVFENDGDGNFNESLGSLTVTDSTYSSGSFGLASRLTFDQRSTEWDNVSVTGVPEPSTLVLLGLAGLLLMKRRRL